jgi:hypothetical protein
MTPSVQTLAALAMDVYNRDDHPGYEYETAVPSIQGFTPGQFWSQPGTSNNFFAKSYVNGDTIVISYRGTDEGNCWVTVGKRGRYSREMTMPTSCRRCDVCTIKLVCIEAQS